MNTINIVSLAVIIITAIIGYFLGLGKSIKKVTGGIVGIIISIFVCVAFGGTLLNYSAAHQLIDYVNTQATNAWKFLRYLQLGYVTFYLAMFIIVQIVRLIVVKAFAKITETDNKVVKGIDKILGAIFCAAFISGIVLLAFAGLKLIDETSFAQNILSKIEDSYLMVIYNNNPINFK